MGEHQSKLLSLSARSTLYEIFNDIIPNKIKMFNNLANIDSFSCDVCGKPDNNVHRFMNCIKTADIWNWVSDIIKNRLKIKITSPHLLLYRGIGKHNCRLKAALWLVCEAIVYNVKNHKNPSLYMFKKDIQDYRWNNRILFCKHFKNYLNIC